MDSLLLGFIAECLLFYDRVFVVMNHKGFESLARVCGPDTLWGLLADGPLQIVYQENRLGVASQRRDGRDYHTFVASEVPRCTAQAFIVKTMQELVGKSGTGRRMGTRICDRIVKRRFDANRAFDWIEEISNSGDIDHFVSKPLTALAPDYQVDETLRFRICRDGDWHLIDSSVNFGLADRAYQLTSAADSHLTPALILSHLYEGQANLVAATEAPSEVGTDPLGSLLATAQIELCLRRARKGAATIQSFQEVLLDARSVGSAIASGERTFEDLRRLIDEASKFRDWVRNQQPDLDLLKEYARACTSVSWAEKLPNKAQRFLLFNSVATVLSLALDPLTGAAVSLGLSAAD